jgi:hypothetical protein
VTALLTLASMALVAVLDAWGRTRREPQPAPPRRNYDVLAPAPRSQATRPVPPVVAPPENPMRDTLIVARPLWWDATERKEYER